MGNHMSEISEDFDQYPEEPKYEAPRKKFRRASRCDIDINEISDEEFMRNILRGFRGKRIALV